jgi:regulator of sirC expression with transglutaminase-like and TPR domain
MLPPDRSQSAVTAFASLVEASREDHLISLAAAALTIARIEYPELAAAMYLNRLAAMADRVRSRLRSRPTASETTTLLNRVLFEEEGLRGNRDDYYDPRNSFLNDVLDRKLGIPISLSVVYMEVARRVGFATAGVGLPGHFLLKHYDARSGEIFIDPFNRGCIMGRDECEQRLLEATAGKLEMRQEFLRPITHRLILTRMLNNLRQIYFSRHDFHKALEVIELLLAIPPRSPELLRERALARLNLDQYLGAAQDLGTYLKLEPEAPDAGDVRETLDMVRQLLGRLN